MFELPCTLLNDREQLIWVVLKSKWKQMHTWFFFFFFLIWMVWGLKQWMFDYIMIQMSLSFVKIYNCLKERKKVGGFECRYQTLPPFIAKESHDSYLFEYTYDYSMNDETFRFFFYTVRNLYISKEENWFLEAMNF